jgi:hypothetical protein
MRALFATTLLLSSQCWAGEVRTFIPTHSELVHCAPDGWSCYAVASCPFGSAVWGGGARGDEAKIESSYPTGGQGWAITFRAATYEYASTANGNAQAFAICSDAPAGYEVISGPQTLCDRSAPSCHTTLTCPATKHALAGGMFGTESMLESSYPSSSQTWTVSWYPDGEDFASTAIGGSIPYAICVDEEPEGYALVQSDPVDCDHDGPSCGAAVYCPLVDGSFLYGGGFYGTESKAEGFGPTDPWSWLATWYPASYEYASTADGLGIAFAMCATGTYQRETIFSDGFDFAGDLNSLRSAATQDTPPDSGRSSCARCERPATANFIAAIENTPTKQSPSRLAQ